MPNRALITGITGQDGAYLAKLLLANGYEVIGGRRWGATSNTWRLEELGVLDRIEFVPLELLEFASIELAIDEVRPTEIYNLAAQSFVASSFHHPVYAGEVTGLGVVRILEAIRRTDPDIKLYQASTSEMFGGTGAGDILTEDDAFRPRSPYAAAKLYAHWMTVNYREAYGLYAVSGILFNHESPLRGIHFVTRKITAGLAQMRHGRTEPIILGNVSATRDWGFAGDYVRGIWAMMRADEPRDFLLATGCTASVREFVVLAGEAAGFRLDWMRLADDTEECRDMPSGRLIARTDANQRRAADVARLRGKASRAKLALNWMPEVGLPELAEMMVAADLERVAKGMPLL